MPPVARARRIREYFGRYRLAFGAGIAFLVLTQVFALTVPQLLRIATDHLASGDWDGVREAALALVLVAVLGAGTRIGSRVYIFNSGRRVEADLRDDLFAHLSTLPPSFYAGLPTGQIMSRAVNDLTQVRLLLGPGLLNLTNTGLIYIVVVPLLLLSDWVLALWALSSLPLLIVSGQFMGKKMYELSRRGQEELGELSNLVQENLGGMMTVRVYQREDAERARFDGVNERYYGTNLTLAKIRGALFPLMGMFGAVGTVVLLWLGGHRVMDGRMSLGLFVEFNAYLAALTWPTIALGWMLSLWQRGLASMDRINELFAVAPSIYGGETRIPAPRGRLEIDGLSFSYPEASRPALDGIRASFEPGETVVIVGPTGSGKSTLLRALARLIEIEPGKVRLDGVDITSAPLEDVRGAISYAPQEAFLFSRTILENVRFGRPEAPRAEVEHAIATASLSPDLSAFPEGVETMVGERGITLSGGQRQRAALARALLVEAPILLLDDTLAAVDTETETKILDALERIAARTTILVTHRLACAARADRILVMDEGRIVEQGTEAELLALGGIYARMHERQRRREAVEQAAREVA